MTNLTFEILGPLTSRRDGTLCRPGRPKARQVLGTLLLHANRFVSADLIADVLWGETPPRSATANIRTYVHDLRHTLVGAAGESPIQTHSCGYSIHVEPARLDSTRFLALAAGAATLATDGDDAGALHTAEQAYTLWRGHPLDDLPMAAAWQMPLGSLEHAHKELLDLLVDLWLRNGRHQPASALLRTRIAEDPYSEPLWCRYISCLADSGRPDEARAAAGEIRRLLTEELGLTPGERLCRLERELATVPGGGTPPASRPTDDADLVTPGRHVPPSQLPLDLSDFTGREAHLSELRALLAGDGPPRPPVAVISGPPGAGKTALAVHLGHLTTARYADGQIFLDLRATTQPREPAAAIAELLRSLGVAEAAIPAELDRRSAMLRSELAGQRVLVVLDDAASASQVAPLLPGTGSSAMLITSRRRLTDLAGVTHRTLGEFDDHEAGALLEQVIAPDRAPLQAAQAEAILRACGNLPLAIRIAGSRLVQRRDLSANDLVARLRDERRRLDELSVGDLTVRTSADLSYRMLGEPEARMYRMLGLLGAEELPAWLLGASGIGPDPERCVAALVEANLVQLTRNDALTTSRYRIHDLLRCHARELAMSTAPEQARQDLATMLTALLGRTTEAAASLPVRFLGVTLDPTPPGDTPDPVSCARDSLANSGAQPAARGVVVADPTPGSTPPPPCEPPPG
ncbi:MAG: BTAD domain-containing putative transcriptional regulator, partial [Micromonosporaceae bacterium]